MFSLCENLFDWGNGRKNSQSRRVALQMFLILTVSAIDPCFAAASFKDADKGQPEMLQPLDNHPMDWTVDEADETGAALDSYRYLLLQRTNEVLLEAIGMLERVKDSRSRRWLEMFIYKLGEIAVQLGGKQFQRKSEVIIYDTPQFVPSSYTATTTVAPAKPVKTDRPSGPVTSTQLNSVLPSSEAILDQQVVTIPGATGGMDELVRQLHDQERLSREENMNVLKSTSTERSAPTSSSLLKTVKNKIQGLPVQDDEKQLLMNVADKLNEFPDIPNNEHRGEKGNHDTADLTTSKQHAVQRKRTSVDERNEFETEEGQEEVHDYSDAQSSGFYFSKPNETKDNSSAQEPRALPVKNAKPNNTKADPEKSNQSPSNQLHLSWSPQQTINHPSALPFYQTFRTVKYIPIPANRFYQLNSEKPHEVLQTFPAQNIVFRPYPGTGYHLNPHNNPQHKPRHPILQQMLLADHGHNPHRMYFNPPRNGFDFFASGSPPKTVNRTDVDDGENKNPNPKTPDENQLSKSAQAKTSKLSMNPPVAKKNVNSVVEANSGDKNEKNEQWGKVMGENLERMGNPRFEQFSFPNPSTFQLQHNMERQLRAGRVVILSDSLVKTNFTENTAKENAPVVETKDEIPPQPIKPKDDMTK